MNIVVWRNWAALLKIIFYPLLFSITLSWHFIKQFFLIFKQIDSQKYQSENIHQGGYTNLTLNLLAFIGCFIKKIAHWLSLFTFPRFSTKDVAVPKVTKNQICKSSQVYQKQSSFYIMDFINCCIYPNVCSVALVNQT